MLDYSFLHWTAFLTAAILLNISPGPDIAYMISHSIRGGKRIGFAAMFGTWAGTMVHVFAAALGLTAILATSATAFTLIKWCGAIYLIWLGMSALRSNGHSTFSLDVGKPARPMRQVFIQGAVVSALNPKIAVFFLAFLPQFVVEGAGPIWMQLALHGTLILAVSAFIEPLFVVMADKLTHRLRDTPRFGLWLDRTLGCTLISLGAWLAVSQR